MIKLNKTGEPDVLLRNKASWTAEYLRQVAAGRGVSPTVAGRYRHEDIKSQLVTETSGKCAYCESKMLHVAFGDIEHIRPKSVNPDLTFEWENLTLVCSVCNNNKRDYDSPTEPLINPYIDNPSDHLRAYGPMVWPKTDSIRGDLTEKLLGLNRKELFERRKERLESLMHLIENWTRETNQTRKDILQRQILEESKEDKEFSLVIKTFLEDSKII